MYTQKDIEEFAYFITLYVFDKAYKKYHGPCDITDSMINDLFEENSLLIAVCNNGSYESYTGFFGKTRIGYMIDSIHKEDKNTFYKTINDVYDINVLFQIGIPMIKDTMDDLPIPQEVLDDIFSYSAEVEAVITPQQLEYIESLEWDCEYWDSLDVKVIDSLDPELRELCLEYYDSLLDDEALDPVENTEPTIGLCKVSVNEFGYVAELWDGDIWDSLLNSDFCEFDELINIIRCNAHFITKLDTSLLNDDDATVLIEHYFDSLPVLIHDVKLDDVELPVIEPLPVEVITPQEVVEEPQEDLSLSTTTNENKTMSIILPDFSTNGNTFQLVPVEFTSIWYEVPAFEPVVELTGQASDFACHISDGWTGQCSELTCDVLSGQCSDVLEGWVGQYFELTCHISDGWFGQCYNIEDAPKPEQPKLTPEQLAEAEARVARACAKMARRSAYASPVRYGTPVNTTPTTTTTKSGKVVQVSPHCVTPYGNAPVSSRVTSPKVTSAIGEASAVDPVDEYKSTLFNLNDYDITRNVVVDVATTTPATPKATPKVPVSTAKFANNFNSSVIAKYTALNGGVIRDSLILNKLTSALRGNNIEAYNKYVTIFNNPQAVALHRQAYDAVISAS